MREAEPRFLLTAAEIRAAEEAVIASGTSVSTLMERAGAACADAILRFVGPAPALILCGPGNNGGDGYVIARRLRERGSDVRVAATGKPRSEAAVTARSAWGGPVSALADAETAPLLVDALFGTGLARPLDPDLSRHLLRLAAAARTRVAVDLPSGASTDDGAIFTPIPAFDLTVALGALKPAHLLQPAAMMMGRLVVADIGVPAESRLRLIGRPSLPPPGPADHKYSRGYVAVVGGEMPGAAALTASAALRAGAGYVRLCAPSIQLGLPHAIVQSGPDLPDDSRIGALAFGPGLGRSDKACAMLASVLAQDRPLVVDADALALTDPLSLRKALHIPILTPHDGEFARLFPDIGGSKLDKARAAAAQANSVIVYKGADTVVAAPDNRAAIAAPSPSWLATAGTGDVLTGIVAAMRARGLEPFDAACAAVWLHARAAKRAGPGMVADDLLADLAPQ